MQACQEDSCLSSEGRPSPNPAAPPAPSHLQHCYEQYAAIFPKAPPFPTGSTSPHRGSSSVYRGMERPVTPSPPSPWRQGLHTTPLPHRVLGRVGGV